MARVTKKTLEKELALYKQLMRRCTCDAVKQLEFPFGKKQNKRRRTK